MRSRRQSHPAARRPPSAPGARWRRDLPARVWPGTGLLCLVAASCQQPAGQRDDQALLARAVETAASDSAGTAVGSGEPAQAAALVSYNAVGKRDPFRSSFSELAQDEPVPRHLPELQRFELDQLRLVAVVVGLATPRAMVEDPSGKGHQVTIGTLLGTHWGQVKHIRRREIVIQEEYRDMSFRRITHLIVMKLAEAEALALD